MMGSGKSAVGRRLAELSGRRYVDTDKLLENRFGRPVSKVFELYGEDCFRGHETSILKGLEPSPIVLATGGGCVLREENWEEFRRLGISIYLHATPERLIERLQVSRKKRPLLQGENWEDKLKNLYQIRSDIYRKAEMHIELDELDIPSVASAVLTLLQERGES